MNDKRYTKDARGARLIIAAGGSGGHIFPAIALGRRIKAIAPEADILFIGSDKALDRRLFEMEGVKFKLLSCNKLPYSVSWRIVPFALKLLCDMIRALFTILAYAPDAVVGFGGYVSFPCIATASLFGIPTLAHEQNAIPGRANKTLFSMAKKVAISFEDTSDSLGPNRDKAILTGNPVRAEILKDDKPSGRKRFGLAPDKFTILVIGGSQGSRALNRTFVEALKLMDPGAKERLQVIHITGTTDYEWALGAYEGAAIESRVHSFIDRIEEAYAASDIAVTRSGASALFELALLGRPMILVPYPFAMSHQKENASAFSKRGAAVVLEERTLTASDFKAAITGLVSDGARLKALGEAARGLTVPDASGRLARAVLELAVR